MFMINWVREVSRGKASERRYAGAVVVIYQKISKYHSGRLRVSQKV